MLVHEIMHEFPVCCTPQETALSAARTMKENNIGVLPVVAKDGAGRLVGIVTDRDLCLGVVAEAETAARVTIESCMTRPAITCGLYDDVRRAMLLMRDHHVRRIPVIDREGAIAGMVSITNLIGNVENEELFETLHKVFGPSPRKMMLAVPA